METVDSQLEQLKKQIISCKLCPELREYCRKVALVKKRAYRDFDYWGKPLPGFGDPHARLLVLGLAPAAHGGNRTGRMFTGDGSGEWLVRVLHKFGFANKDSSVNVNDGLVLKDAYLSAAVRCAPPANKPNRREIDNCAPFLSKELSLLEHLKVVLTLGRIAFDSYLSHVSSKGFAERPVFVHGVTYRPNEGGSLLVVSYHPSRQNTQTRRMTWEAWEDVFENIRRILG